MALQGTIGVAGGGNMGRALIKGMLDVGLVDPVQMVVAEKLADKAADLSHSLGVTTVPEINQLPPLDILILAVKPKDIPSAARSASRALKPDSLVISLAAGITLEKAAHNLPADQPLVRSMPNTPALVGMGATAICSRPELPAIYMEKARAIFEAVGKVVVVPEYLMDAVTGLSGSGPSFIAVIVEAFIDAGVRVGLDRDTSRVLVTQTLAGTAELLLQTGAHPGQMKDMVTSPGGTAIAGLHVLEQKGVRGHIMDIVAASTARSQELGRQ